MTLSIAYPLSTLLIRVHEMNRWVKVNCCKDIESHGTKKRNTYLAMTLNIDTDHAQQGKRKNGREWLASIRQIRLDSAASALLC